MPRFINGILIFTGVDEPVVSVGFVLWLNAGMAETLAKVGL
jgi:hypothetical protein